MPRYTVFLGAPPPHESLPTAKYEWETIQYPNKVTDAELESDRLKSPGRLSGQEQEKQESFWTGYAPASLEAASRRISVLYRDVIFKDKDEEEEDGGRLWDAVDVVDQSDALREQTTAYTWDLTTAASIDPIVTDTFLHAAPSRIVGGGVGGETQYETQLTAISSDASSLLLLPAFRFLISSITPLRALRTTRPSYSVPLYILVAVLELDGPDTVRIKRGPDAGKEVDVLKVIVGDDEGVVAKCTAWRDVAETWGALSGLKRGDIVCISHIQSSWDPRSPLTLTASPSLRSSAEICFRTLPRASFAEADARLRPDLALGAGDPAVRRVAALVRWFEVMAGLAR